MKQKFFSDIMHEYEKMRVENTRILNARKQQLYLREPSLLQIENELSCIGIGISKLILNGAKESDLHALQSENKNLLRKRENILLKLNLPENYLSVYNCYDCKDTGYVENNRCKCFTQKLIEKYYDMSNLKNIVRKENFDTFDMRYYKDEKTDNNKSALELIKKAYEKSLQFVNNFDNGPANLLFYGKTGLGKTFLCNCIAKEILDKGKTVLYATAPQLFKILESIRFSKNESDYKNEYNEMIFNADLLIIDDLGTEFATLPLQSELFNIINTRMLAQNPVIISTNFFPQDLREQYTDRIVSRFVGNYTWLQFAGEDIRLQKKNKTTKFATVSK